MKLKLGKHAPRHDPRTFKLAKYLTALPPVPAAINWTGKISAWGMMLNDSEGDCAIAAPGHHEMLWTSQSGAEFIPTDDQIQAAYSAVGGYVPGNPATDQGCNMLDVLNYWRNTGIAGRKIQAYAQVDHQNQSQIEAAIYLFGGMYTGVQLPQSAMDATESGSEWADTTDTNILGGHAIAIVAYDEWSVACVTWGQIQLMTWAWLFKYADEAYAPLSSDWLAATGQSPSGFNQQQLADDLNSL